MITFRDLEYTPYDVASAIAVVMGRTLYQTHQTQELFFEDEHIFHDAIPHFWHLKAPMMADCGHGVLPGQIFLEWNYSLAQQDFHLTTCLACGSLVSGGTFDAPCFRNLPSLIPVTCQLVDCLCQPPKEG